MNIEDARSYALSLDCTTEDLFAENWLSYREWANGSCCCNSMPPNQEWRLSYRLKMGKCLESTMKE